jgi:CheY-like chemotaxis protein
MYAEFFLHAGLRVSHAVDGDHALWKVLGVYPDLVVMDLAMPGVDGCTATRKIKDHPKTKHIPVIALTGHVLPESLTRAEQSGADAVLTKPCSPQDLLSLVQTILDR